MRALLFKSCVSLWAVSSLIVSAQAGNGQPPASAMDQSGYGGGFVEMLQTGEDPTPLPGVHYNRPPSGQQLQQYLAQQRAQNQAYQQQASAQTQAVPAPRVLAAPAAAQALPPHAIQQAAVAAPAAADPRAMAPARTLPPALQRQLVAYNGHEHVGTIVVDTPNKFLYLVTSQGQALRYGIGVGRPGFEWAGVKTITRKAEWPEWIPPAEMLQRRPDLPVRMAGGPDNPLGARVLYLGSTLYRIHGTNEPATIGQNVSSGCIRMMNEDVVDLYERVPVGTKVIIM